MEAAKSTTSTSPKVYKYSKERTIIRRLFTVSANLLEEIFKSGEAKITELKCEYNKIDQLHNKLLELNERIKCEIYENIADTNLEKEILSAEDYTSKFITIKTMYETIINKSNKVENNGEHVKKTNRYYKLPEIKFKKFNGEILNWLGFWGQFKKIDQDPGLDDDDKLFYLMQNIETDTEVYSLVASYPPTGASYTKCIQELKQRYAREDLLIEVYVRELLALVLKGNNSNLIELHDKLNAHLRALESLGISKYHHAFILPLVESALPIEILKLWERNKGNIIRQNKNPEEVLENLMAFLKTEIESMQRVEISKHLAQNDQNEKVATASCLLTQQREVSHKTCCIWCDKDSHSSSDCYKVHKLTLEQRQEIIRTKKACGVCLKIGHFSKSCKSSVKCFICQKRHSTAVCYVKENKQKNLIKPNTTTSLSSQNYSTETLLQTIIINIRNGEQLLPVRALFDSGSQRSYICEDIARKLKLKPTGQEKLNHCLFGNFTTQLESHNIYKVTLESLNSDFKMDIEALSQTAICGKIPKLNLNKETCKILQRHQISLPDLNSEIKDIGILIGADFAGFMLTSNVVVMENGLVAIKTKLGWTIQGRQINTSPNNFTTSMFCMSVSSNSNLTDFWTMEILGIQDPVEMKSRAEGEAEAVCTFERTVRTLPDGRYEVELPFKVGFDDLLSNYDRAKKRLDSNTKKLISSGKFQDYDAILQEWLKLGIIEKGPSDIHHSHNSGHYLPHKAILKESSLTSALRPVFDASCPDKNGLCLNACLEKGINYIEHIPKLLIGFRKGAIGIISDIAKAFLQISLRPEDRAYLKFLWWETESMDKIVEYRHCRVVFGLTCSPFLLSATIMHHLNKISGEYEQTAQLLKNSFYVDNCVTSLDSEEETRRFIQESKEIMKEAQFDLRMWTTSPLQINEAGKVIISVLGLNWDTESDELSCNITDLPPPEMLHKLTKRVVLSLTQKVFDPIGFTCPVTLAPRLLLQEMWRRELSWDESLPQDIAKQFLKWYNNLGYLKSCKIPRRLTNNKLTDCKLSLHMFCDASKNAMAACIFLRAEKLNNVSVQLIAAKSRVAPPKSISIPRLELMAAVIGVRLLTETRKSLNLANCNEYYWTDSSVTLYWICNNLSWNVFVGNRVKEIRKGTNTGAWSHIPGSSNWADLASRGCDAKQLLECRWVEGPDFLLRSTAEWPKTSVNVGTADEAVAKKELKRQAKSTCIINVQETENFSDRLLYFSKYTKIVRVVAWLTRFAGKGLKNKVNKNITSDEYENAERKLFLLLQRENKDNLKLRCKNIHTLEDQDQLIRIKTRLLLSDMPENTKCPILLPAKSEIVRRLVEQKHAQLQHAGTNILIAEIRKSYWIFGIRRLVRSVITNCIICKRFKVKQMQAPVAPLPVDRMKSSLPFEVTGVDLAGPLILKNGEKCWIVLFTCAVYRAVHLELTLSLSTEAFLRTLRRFIARRGRIKIIYSDNGTNLVGSKNLIDSINWEEVQQETCIEKIKWKLNAPTGAWWGGFFERLIRSMKDLLRKILGKASVTYDELHTILCECESIMNNRPLTYIQDDNADSLEPLTPACFLQPLPSSDTADLDLLDSKSLNIRLKYLQKLRDDFRHRFRTEYLTELIQRGKEKGKFEELKEGQVVLIETEEKRIKWPLGVIAKIYSGKDGVNRTALIKTAVGSRVRPIQRLYSLEVSSSELNVLPTPKRTQNTEKGKLSPTPNIIITNKDETIGKDATHTTAEPEQFTRHGRRIIVPSKYKL